MTDTSGATGVETAGAQAADLEAQPAPESGSRRWWGLVVIGLAQLIILLDGTVVNIALPSAQAELGMSDATRQWAITSYALAFGGLLLLGGRLSDLVGRKRMFLLGTAGFGIASAVAGAASGPGMLFAGRALQGVFAALLAPSGLALLNVTFTDPKERSRAFGVFGAVAGAGAAVGLIVGGLLTEYMNWRWCLYLSVPVAVIVLVAGAVLLRDVGSRASSRLDLLGVLLATGGLVALVYGFGEAGARGWSDTVVAATLVGGVALVVLFVVWQGRCAHPLLPLRIVRHRQRAGAYLTSGLGPIAMFALFLFMTYYLQVVLEFSSVKAGLAFLPLTLSMLMSSTQIAARLLPHVAPRTLVVPGVLLTACGMLLLTRMSVDSSYVTRVLPAMILAGVGMGATMMTAMATATSGVAPEDTGVASAMVNTTQQMGGAIGTAVLNTVAATATSGYLHDHLTGSATPAQRARVAAEGVVHGFSVALWWVVGLLVLTAVLAAALLKRDTPGGQQESA
ncbi:MFS transporter [Streptomyces hygroscopicus]|uniref:MFS transporter n=1 Tax=Streptomyces hygroscopicus TaxID=1912 RepID=UPI001FCCB0C8|nr:MFS transporter [Streptomyces hygroscopicus]BDH13430.1 MFS transporter [Streptomyces hygroscopicus]